MRLNKESILAFLGREIIVTRIGSYVVLGIRAEGENRVLKLAVPQGGIKDFYWVDASSSTTGGIYTFPDKQLWQDINGEVAVIPPSRTPESYLPTPAEREGLKEIFARIPDPDLPPPPESFPDQSVSEPSLWSSP